MSKRKYVHYTTPDRVAKINPKNTELWEKYLNSKRTLSQSSKDSYTNDINQFFVYIMLNCDNKFLFDFETEYASDMIDDYIGMCSFAFGNKDRRLCRRLSSISSLYIHYKKKRKIKENPVELIDRPKAQKGVYEIKQTFLTQEQVDQIRDGLEKINDTQLSLFFELGIYTMLRVNALSNIKLENIDLDKKRIIDIIEKEGYNVTASFSDRCKELIVKWLDERKEQDIENQHLFIVKYDGKWTQAKPSTLKGMGWIKRIGKIIGVPELHCHDLRHSGSNLRYKAGMKLEEVSEALNHKSTSVTKDFYLQVDYDAIQEKLEKFDI